MEKSWKQLSPCAQVVYPHTRQRRPRAAAVAHHKTRNRALSRAQHAVAATLQGSSHGNHHHKRRLGGDDEEEEADVCAVAQSLEPLICENLCGN